MLQAARKPVQHRPPTGGFVFSCDLPPVGAVGA